eukprot:759364-Hanusia_phi.AAC.8
MPSHQSEGCNLQGWFVLFSHEAYEQELAKDAPSPVRYPSSCCYPDVCFVRGRCYVLALLCGVLHAVGVQAAVSGCDAGSTCCTLPPCRCGTYVTCLANTNCMSAVCEICPPGSYCTCEAGEP